MSQNLNSAFFTFQDRCLVLPDPAEEKTQGGIIIPDTAKETPKRGTVVLVGPEAANHLKVGDTVFYGRHSGQPIKIEGVEYVSVRISEMIVAEATETQTPTAVQKTVMSA